MDLLRHGERQWRGGFAQPPLELGRVDQPAGDVDVFAVGGAAVAVHLAGVHRDAQPERQLGAAFGVLFEQDGQRGDDGGEQERLGQLVEGADQAEGAVAAVDEGVAVLAADPAGREGFVEQLEQDGAEPGAHRVRPLGRVLDVDRHDGPVPGYVSRSVHGPLLPSGVN